MKFRQLLCLAGPYKSLTIKQWRVHTNSGTALAAKRVLSQLNSVSANILGQRSKCWSASLDSVGHIHPEMARKPESQICLLLSLIYLRQSELPPAGSFALLSYATAEFGAAKSPQGQAIAHAWKWDSPTLWILQCLSFTTVCLAPSGHSAAPVPVARPVFLA